MNERWLITGATGQLGGHIVRALERDTRSKQVLKLSRGAPHKPDSIALNLSDTDAVARCVCDWRPTHVVHCGAMTAVADCFADPQRAECVNTAATSAIADAAESCAARLVHVSTDMVFGGDRAPYVEVDPPAPLSVYGRTKADAESAVIGRRRALVVRVPLMYGPPVTPRETTFTAQIAALRARHVLRLFADEHRTPVALADAARALVALARSDFDGCLHIAGPERLSRLEMVLRFARELSIADPLVEPISRSSIQSAEPRPADLSLDGSRLAREFPQIVCGPIRRAVLSAE